MRSLQHYEKQRAEFPQLEFAQLRRHTKDEEREMARFPEIGPPEVRVEGTAFYDAIYYSIEDRLSTVSKGRRALVVFSDGEDNSSAHHLLDTLEAAESGDILIYAFGTPIKNTRKRETNMGSA